LLRCRRDDNDIAKAAQLGFQSLEPRSVNTIVVGQQY
jgi:hypothetical protein